MNFKVTLLKKENYRPTFWSGGMAKELTTYPINSDYASRNFLWRLGVAKIDIDKSEFSSLPGVSRNLMVTEGSITLMHKDKYTKELTEFNQDTFIGDWHTTTNGKASVFNLMTRENYSGTLKVLDVLSMNNIEFVPLDIRDKKLTTICLYPIFGSFKVKLNSDYYNIEENDLLVVNCTLNTSITNLTLENTTNKNTKVIVSSIYYS